MFWIGVSSAVPAQQCAAASSSRPPSSGPGPSRQEMRSRCARRNSGGVKLRPGRLSPFRRGHCGPAGGRGVHSGLVVAAAGAALQPPGNARPGTGRQSRAARPGPTNRSRGLEGRGLFLVEGRQAGTTLCFNASAGVRWRAAEGTPTTCRPQTATLFHGCNPSSILLAD